MRGRGLNFEELRGYLRGDDPRHIDWRVFYRREKYFVKQYEMETNFVCHLVLDGTWADQELFWWPLWTADLATAAPFLVMIGLTVFHRLDNLA